MLTDAVESYLAVRRAAGLKLKVTGRLLRSFANFASQQGDVHVRSATAIEWVSLSSTPQHGFNINAYINGD